MRSGLENMMKSKAMKKKTNLPVQFFKNVYQIKKLVSGLLKRFSLNPGICLYFFDTNTIITETLKERIGKEFLRIYKMLHDE